MMAEPPNDISMLVPHHQNWSHFSYDEIMVPRGSEEHHIYALNSCILIICVYSELPVDYMNIKHDVY